jgi:hypothetical protein
MRRKCGVSDAERPFLRIKTKGMDHAPIAGSHDHSPASLLIDIDGYALEKHFLLRCRSMELDRSRPRDGPPGASRRSGAKTHCSDTKIIDPES